MCILVAVDPQLEIENLWTTCVDVKMNRGQRFDFAQAHQTLLLCFMSVVKFTPVSTQKLGDSGSDELLVTNVRCRNKNTDIFWKTSIFVNRAIYLFINR